MVIFKNKQDMYSILVHRKTRFNIYLFVFLFNLYYNNIKEKNEY